MAKPGKRERAAMRAAKTEFRLKQEIVVAETHLFYSSMWSQRPKGRPRLQWGWDYQKHLSMLRTKGRIIPV